jgi:hypothetical protein
MVIHLTANSRPPRGAFRRACDRYPRRAPEFPPRPGRRPGVSVWPCTAWGLSCPGSCPPGGGLLPRLFTLAATPVRARHGGLFSVTLSIDRNFRPGPPRVFPRHAALWCSDFPLPPKRERPSTHREYSPFYSRAQVENGGVKNPGASSGAFWGGPGYLLPGCASAASRAHRRSPESGHRLPTSCSRGMSPREPGQRVVRATRERQAEASFGEFHPRD